MICGPGNSGLTKLAALLVCLLTPATAWAEEHGPNKPDLDALYVAFSENGIERIGATGSAAKCDSEDADTLLKCEMNILRRKIGSCWNAGTIIGAPEPEKLVVVIDFDLNPDGMFSSPPRVVNDEQIELSEDPFWILARQAALDAVTNCEPYDFFSEKTYDMWKEISLTFDPSAMYGR